jgi:Xaa-Pro aminopeptidase
MRADLLTHLFKAYNIDAYVSPMEDDHLNEFINKNDNRIQYLTGFTGTAGTAITSKDFKALITDGRYYSQAKKQLQDYVLVKRNEYNVSELLISKNIKRVGIDPHFISFQKYNNMKKALEKKGIQLIDTEDLVGKIWKDRPARVFNSIENIEAIKISGILNEEQKIRNSEEVNALFENLVPKNLEYDNITGSSRNGKIELLKSLLNTNEAFLVSELDSIAWIFNLRGSDIVNNTVFYSYAYISKDQVILFTNGNVNLENVIIKKYNEFEKFISEPRDTKIIVSGNCNAYIAKKIKNLGFSLKIRELKAIKNEAEIYGMLKANLYDGVALVQLFEWIEDIKTTTEKEIANKLIEIKQSIPDFKTTSFDSIVAIGSNSAELHHANSDRAINDTVSEGKSAGEMILIDSGSQFLYGTTDITRTLNMNPDEDQREKFTLVLKGALSSRMYKSDKITGGKLDELSRKYLNAEGYDYNSATGHGIGAGLIVHENPPFISRNEEDELVKNSVFSIEPGFYQENKYGIRIEDVVAVNQANGLKETVDLTYVPLHMKLIDPKKLSNDEIRFLNTYNRKVKTLLEPLVGNSSGQRYLRENTGQI